MGSESLRTTLATHDLPGFRWIADDVTDPALVRRWLSAA